MLNDEKTSHQFQVSIDSCTARKHLFPDWSADTFSFEKVLGKFDRKPKHPEHLSRQILGGPNSRTLDSAVAEGLKSPLIKLGSAVGKGLARPYQL